jgi:hypothetical protein
MPRSERSPENEQEAADRVCPIAEALVGVA